MSKQTTWRAGESSPSWETLEAWVRERIQGFLQALLEEEVTAFLGRRKSERRRLVDARPGDRNGYGKPRRVSLTSGTITVRSPRLRGLAERFESRLPWEFLREMAEAETQAECELRPRKFALRYTRHTTGWPSSRWRLHRDPHRAA